MGHNLFDTSLFNGPAKPQRLLLGGGYLTLSDNIYHHYITDYQGNVVLLINTKDRSVEQQTGYYPYGMPHGDAVGADAQPNKYSGKRLQTFAGMDTYDFHARQLPIGIPRFDRPDPFAENFRQLGLYTYCAGDPVNFTDPTGMEYDFTPMLTKDLNMGNDLSKRIIRDAALQAGIYLYLNSLNQLDYIKYSNGTPVIRYALDENGKFVETGSVTARNALIGGIDSKEMVKVDYGTPNHYNEDLNVIAIDQRDVEANMQGAHGVDAETVGYGMTFFHENFHSPLGGSLKDPQNGVGTGDVVDKCNKIREELDLQGKNMGIRKSYRAFDTKDGAILPFDQETFEWLERGNTKMKSHHKYVRIKFKKNKKK